MAGVVPINCPLPNQCGWGLQLQALEAARAGQLFELGKPEKNKSPGSVGGNMGSISTVSGDTEKIATQRLELAGIFIDSHEVHSSKLTYC